MSLGRNESYLHQYLTRGHPVELGERDRERLAEILEMSPDDLRSLENPRRRLPNGTSAKTIARLQSASGEDDLRCRVYEQALRKIVTKEPTSAAAAIAKAALRLFE